MNSTSAEAVITQAVPPVPPDVVSAAHAGPASESNSGTESSRAARPSRVNGITESPPITAGAAPVRRRILDRRERDNCKRSAAGREFGRYMAFRENTAL